MTPPAHLRVSVLALITLVTSAASAACTAAQPKGPAFHLQLVSSSSRQPITAALVEVEGPHGTVSERTDCKGAVALRLPQGTWPVRVGPSASCQASRSFLLPIAQPDEAYELFALDDDARMCPAPLPAAEDRAWPACVDRNPPRLVRRWRAIVPPTRYMFDHPYLGATRPGLAEPDLRALPLRDVRDL